MDIQAKYSADIPRLQQVIVYELRALTNSFDMYGNILLKRFELFDQAEEAGIINRWKNKPLSEQVAITTVKRFLS